MCFGSDRKTAATLNCMIRSHPGLWDVWTAQSSVYIAGILLLHRGHVCKMTGVEGLAAKRLIALHLQNIYIYFNWFLFCLFCPRHPVTQHLSMTSTKTQTCISTKWFMEWRYWLSWLCSSSKAFFTLLSPWMHPANFMTTCSRWYSRLQKL